MIGFLLLLHILVCIFLVIVILLQSSKGSGLAGAFGGMGGAGAIFGGRGAATFLSKLTTVLAVLFMLSSVTHSFISRSATTPNSLIQEEARKGGLSPAAQLPAIPGAIPEGQSTQQQTSQPTQPEGTPTTQQQSKEQPKK